MRSARGRQRSSETGIVICPVASTLLQERTTVASWKPLSIAASFVASTEMVTAAGGEEVPEAGDHLSQSALTDSTDQLTAHVADVPPISSETLSCRIKAAGLEPTSTANGDTAATVGRGARTVMATSNDFTV